MENLEIKVPSCFGDKFEELVKNVPFENVSELHKGSFIIGFYRYWLQYQSILNDITDKDLSAAEVSERTHEIYRKIKTVLTKAEDIESYERKFERIHPYNNSEEHCDTYYLEFIKYLESPPEQVIKEILRGVEAVTHIKQKESLLTRVKARRREKKGLEKPELPFKLLPRPDKYALHKHGLYIGISTVICFITFMLLFWFAPQIWFSFPYYFFAMVLLFALIFIVIFGFIALFYYYFFPFPSLEEWQANREKHKIKRELKTLRKEFNQSHPKTIFEGPFKYRLEFSKFITEKYKTE